MISEKYIPVLAVKSISKTYEGVKALDNVSLTIPKGSIYGLLGPNGAGKTTLIRIINQILVADSGTVSLDGELLEAKHIAHIGYLPEERGLYRNMKIEDQAMYLGRLKGLSKEAAAKNITYWFNKFGIDAWRGKKIEELSKGMAQKVQFIITVLHKPKLLIFDEPFSGFDPVNAALIANEILQLKEEGATVIFSTHRMESVEKMCDHIALIHKSKKILEGSLQEIQQKFKSNRFEVILDVATSDAFYKALSSKYTYESNLIKPHVKGEQFEVVLGENDEANTLLLFLANYGELIHFSEKTPSVDSIFIKAVQQNPTF